MTSKEDHQKTNPEPKGAHILITKHLKYTIILGQVHHLHPQTNRIQGKQILIGNQQDRRPLNATKACKALNLHSQDEQAKL